VYVSTSECTQTPSNRRQGQNITLFTGQFLLSQQRYAEAATKLEDAVALSETPEFEDVVTAATSLRLAGDFNSAENYYKLAISLRPQVSASY
jgi:hypothetical protein